MGETVGGCDKMKEIMIGQEKVYERLKELGIGFDYLEHPAAPTIEIARQYWKNLDSTHCKNLFFRNHKGNRHYLVIFHCDRSLAIHDLEQLLKQGKLSFASEQRMEKYLGLKPGFGQSFRAGERYGASGVCVFGRKFKAGAKVVFPSER